MKAFLVLCELLTLGLLAWLLAHRGLPLERLLILAWSPLALVEIAGSGHNEAFGMLWMTLALLALDLDRPLVSALCAGAGLLSKYLPGLVAAAWAPRYRPWQLAVSAAACAPLVLLYLDAGSRKTMLLSLAKYSEFWRFNETLFAPLAALLGGHASAVRGGALLTLALALWLGWRRAEPVAAATAVVVASLLLSPNVLPWYALWLLPLLVVRDEPAALLFTGTVSLAYLVYPAWQSGEPWKLGWGWRVLEYGPPALVALWSFKIHPSRRGGGTSSPPSTMLQHVNHPEVRNDHPTTRPARRWAAAGDTRRGSGSGARLGGDHLGRDPGAAHRQRRAGAAADAPADRDARRAGDARDVAPGRPDHPRAAHPPERRSHRDPRGHARGLPEREADPGRARWGPVHGLQPAAQRGERRRRHGRVPRHQLALARDAEGSGCREPAGRREGVLPRLEPGDDDARGRRLRVLLR